MDSFVIVEARKATTMRSYYGPASDRANIRQHYKPVYEKRDEAEKLAELLSRVGPEFEVRQVWTL